MEKERALSIWHHEAVSYSCYTLPNPRVSRPRGRVRDARKAFWEKLLPRLTHGSHLSFVLDGRDTYIIRRVSVLVTMRHLREHQRSFTPMKLHDILEAVMTCTQTEVSFVVLKGTIERSCWPCFCRMTQSCDGLDDCPHVASRIAS